MSRKSKFKLSVNAERGSLADQLAEFEDAAFRIQRLWRHRGPGLIYTRNRRRAAISTAAHGATGGMLTNPVGDRLVSDTAVDAPLPYLKPRLWDQERISEYGPRIDNAFRQERRDSRNDWIAGGLSQHRRRFHDRALGKLGRWGNLRRRINEPGATAPATAQDLIESYTHNDAPWSDPDPYHYNAMLNLNRTYPISYNSGVRYGAPFMPTYTMPSGRHYRTRSDERVFDAAELESKKPPTNAAGDAVRIPGEINRLINDFAFGIPGAPGVHNDFALNSPGVSRRNVALRSVGSTPGHTMFSNYRFPRHRGSWGPRQGVLDYPLYGRSGPVRYGTRFGPTDPLTSSVFNRGNPNYYGDSDVE